MNAGLVAQYAVIALLVVGAAVYMLRRLAPKLTTRWQAGIAGALLKSGRPAFAQRVGRALQPAAATGDCGDGCGSCGSCGTSSSAPSVEEAPLTFHPQRRS